jgi:transcriptional regulator with XRE-family HTH domain
MDPVRVGSDVRLLRLRRGWSQRRLAAVAHVSRWAVATLESGRAGRVSMETASTIVAALGGYLSVRVLYRGEGLDRLRDQRHAEIVEILVGLLSGLGWEVATEVSFNNFGERGSIDVLAYHRLTRILLVIEVKTVVPDLGGALATFDRKARLARDIARQRGWNATLVAKLLVLPEDRTARRRVAQHDATFTNAFPARNVEVNAWLKAPSGPLSGLIFLSTARRASQRQLINHSEPGPSSRPRTRS